MKGINNVTKHQRNFRLLCHAHRNVRMANRNIRTQTRRNAHTRNNAVQRVLGCRRHLPRRHRPTRRNQKLNTHNQIGGWLRLPPYFYGAFIKTTKTNTVKTGLRPGHPTPSRSRNATHPLKHVATSTDDRLWRVVASPFCLFFSRFVFFCCDFFVIVYIWSGCVVCSPWADLLQASVKANPPHFIRLVRSCHVSLY